MSARGGTRAVLGALVAAAGDNLLDLHTDTEHHRSVLTLGGPIGELEPAVRAVAVTAVDRIDLTAHVGVHPRLGALDVVPFVPVGATLRRARRGGRPWEPGTASPHGPGATLDLPCFLYGPERTLPDIRRHAFGSLAPDTGPITPHPTAGAAAVGARLLLVAYNLWIEREQGR